MQIWRVGKMLPTMPLPDPLQSVKQLRQTLAADQLYFFLADDDIPPCASTGVFDLSNVMEHANQRIGC